MFHPFLFVRLTTLVSAASALQPPDQWTLVTPGGSDDLSITDQNTWNSTTVDNLVRGISDAGQTLSFRHRPATLPKRGTRQLPIEFRNHVINSNVSLYVLSRDLKGTFKMLHPDSHWYYPQVAPGQGQTQVDPTTITIPLIGAGPLLVTILNDATSARVYYAVDGKLVFFVNGNAGVAQLVMPIGNNKNDPNAAVWWGFAEFDSTEDNGIFINPSRVDFVGAPANLKVQQPDGTFVEAPSIFRGSLTTICNQLSAQIIVDSQPWGQLCMVNDKKQPVQALSPKSFLDVEGNADAFVGYWAKYIGEVWIEYTNEPLYVTQVQHGAGSTCQPTASEIFRCDGGPFIQTDLGAHNDNAARLCAAFMRSTLLLEGGNVQPSLPASSFYLNAPTDYYSKIVHNNSHGGVEYTFSYDDVHADGQPDVSGSVAVTEPQLLRIVVGAYH